MHRITLRVPAEQVDRIEALVDAGVYPNQSEAIRAAIRELVGEEADRIDAYDTHQQPTVTDGGRS